MSPKGNLVKNIDVVIIGNGPSALLLSYILHGNYPFYDTLVNHHPDRILDSKIKSNLLEAVDDLHDLTAHFPSARFSYSSAALPINVLLDTLLRPLDDTEPGKYKSCVKWEKGANRSVPHLLLGSTLPGGQWASNPVKASWDIGALSYLDQLSLPGYSLREHLSARYDATESDFVRPTKAEVADYLAAYPTKVGIEDAIFSPTVVSDIVRTKDGFYIESHSIACKQLVLASGLFANLLPARPQLQPLLQLPENDSFEPPLLVVGSGFSAADILITNLPKRKVIHVFKWDPETRPSPLRACHKQAYPEYARVYRQMKLAASLKIEESENMAALARQKSNTLKNTKADPNYEGFPNTYIAQANALNGVGAVELCLPNGELTKRAVSNLEYVIGRRGSLSYLDSHLLEEVVGTQLSAEEAERISGRTLRSKVEEDLEVAPGVLVIGSLTGDSLIRHAYGSCVYAARKILSAYEVGTADSRGSIKYQETSEQCNGSIPDGLLHNHTIKDNKDEAEMLRKDIETETAEPNRRRKRDQRKAGGCVVI
ncbi:MAG: hypothetical protein LQ340_007764 [Diploschistes diacapsis]|nr:MAG: hypothetical protein LQ340_007764 [Diploschistes diacapsis]